MARNLKMDTFQDFPDISDALEDLGFSGKKSAHRPVRYSSGILSLDRALNGGFQNGMTLISGKPSSGRSTLSMFILKHAQSLSLRTMVVPNERMDLERYQMVGVDMDNLAVLRAGDDIMHELVSDFVRRPNSFVVVDSVTHHSWDLQQLQNVRHSLDLSSVAIFVTQVQSKPKGGLVTGNVSPSIWRYEDLFNTSLFCSMSKTQEDSATMSIEVQEGANLQKVELPFSKKFGIDVEMDLLKIAVDQGQVVRKGSAGYLCAGNFLGTSLEEAARTIRSNGKLSQYLQELYRRSPIS